MSAYHRIDGSVVLKYTPEVAAMIENLNLESETVLTDDGNIQLAIAHGDYCSASTALEIEAKLRILGEHAIGVGTFHTLYDDDKDMLYLGAEDLVNAAKKKADIDAVLAAFRLLDADGQQAFFQEVAPPAAEPAATKALALDLARTVLNKTEITNSDINYVREMLKIHLES